MTPHETLSALAAGGAAVRTNGSTLFVSPREFLTPELRENIRRNKFEIVALVRERERDALGERIRREFLMRLTPADRGRYLAAAQALDNRQQPMEES